jgi:hypothetical protein|tara:strand:+ start:103 stop:510 length:408 start_codon:yes stop_codon:yes gene_type:complete
MSVYVKLAAIERGRRKRDFIYRLLVSNDTAELDKEIKRILRTCKGLNGASKDLQNVLKKTLSGKDRAAKQSIFFFALFNSDNYRKLISKRIDVNTGSLQRFCDGSLKQHTADLLDGRLVCLLDWILTLRHAYIIS